MNSINRTRIVKNTGLLYFRMFLTMAVSLYTSRVILSILGVEDFGIYGIVYGVAGVFAFFNAAFSDATSRFITFELGRGDSERLKKTFSTSLNIHWIIALLVLLLGETAGIYLLENKLDIPLERMPAARWVYQLSLFVTLAGIIRVPYNALIIAHEKMAFYAYAEIANVVLKLALVYLLWVGHFDKLILYAVLTLGITLLILGIHIFYCLRKFEESHYEKTWDKQILYPMLKFSGWYLIGNVGDMARTQGVNILLNIFFGPLFNAASAVATQVQGAVSSFGTNVLTAVKPQIVKSYAAGEQEQTCYLVCNASKFTYLLLLAISLPLILEMDYVLSLWLNVVPGHSALFCQITLVFNLLYAIRTPLSLAIHATGEIQWINIVNGTLYFLVLPITWFAYRQGAAPEFSYIVNTLVMFITLFTSLLILKRNMGGFPWRVFIYKVLGMCLLITFLSGCAALPAHYFLPRGFPRLLVVTLLSTSTLALCTWSMAVPKNMKKILKNRALQYAGRIANRKYDA